MKEAVFLLTKDRNRLDNLSATVRFISQCNCEIFIIDDSSEPITLGLSTYSISDQDRIHIINKLNQFEIIEKIPIDYREIFKPIGVKYWNTGNARNLAIAISVINNVEKLLFIDDDIQVESKAHILETFMLLNEYDIVSSKITGCIDESIVGHIRASLGHDHEEYFSGGYLAINTKKISFPFINYYNEDWIWSHMHKFDVKMTKIGAVKQIWLNNSSNHNKKIFHQEFGECLLRGIESIIDKTNLNDLFDINYWRRIIEERCRYLEKMKIEIEEKRTDEIEIIDIAIDKLFKISPNSLLKVYELCFDNSVLLKKFIKNDH